MQSQDEVQVGIWCLPAINDGVKSWEQCVCQQFVICSFHEKSHSKCKPQHVHWLQPTRKKHWTLFPLRTCIPVRIWSSSFLSSDIWSFHKLPWIRGVFIALHFIFYCLGNIKCWIFLMGENTKNQLKIHHRDNALFTLSKIFWQGSFQKQNDSDDTITQSQKKILCLSFTKMIFTLLCKIFIHIYYCKRAFTFTVVRIKIPYMKTYFYCCKRKSYIFIIFIMLENTFQSQKKLLSSFSRFCAWCITYPPINPSSVFFHRTAVLCFFLLHFTHRMNTKLHISKTKKNLITRWLAHTYFNFPILTCNQN